MTAGHTFGKSAVQTHFRSPAFVVNACPIQIELEQDGTVFLGYGFGGLSSSDAVAVEWKAELKDGMCVRPER